jgi:recombination protein RecA
MSDEFDNLFKSLEKSMSKEKEKNAQMFDPSDLRMLSFVPHGIPTRQPMFDLTIGKDGVPIGKVIEFFGFERSGKTTAAYHLIGEVQRMGGAAMFIDTEMSFDPIRAKECGCAVGGSSLKVMTAASSDAIFRTIDRFLDTLKENGFERDVLIVVDSVTAVSSEATEDKTWKAQGRLGEDARVLRSGLRRIMPKLAEQKVTVLFINHAINNTNSYGKQSQAAGGHAIKFFASLRAEFKNEGEVLEAKGDKELEERERYGQKVQITIEKLKGGHLKSMVFHTQLLNIGGFDSAGQLLDACMEIGIVKKANNTTYVVVGRNGDEKDAFMKAEWPDWIQRHGGFDECYKWWRQHAVEKGHITPWGHVPTEE